MKISIIKFGDREYKFEWSFTALQQLQKLSGKPFSKFLEDNKGKGFCTETYKMVVYAGLQKHEKIEYDKIDEILDTENAFVKWKEISGAFADSLLHTNRKNEEVQDSGKK